MFYELFEALFGLDPRPAEPQVMAEPALKESGPSKQSICFDDDVEKLESRFGKLKTGLCIETTLQDLLKICPRTRQRTDAYNRLVAYLKETYGVKLIIKSRKKK